MAHSAVPSFLTSAISICDGIAEVLWTITKNLTILIGICAITSVIRYRFDRRRRGAQNLTFSIVEYNIIEAGKDGEDGIEAMHRQREWFLQKIMDMDLEDLAQKWSVGDGVAGVEKVGVDEDVEKAGAEQVEMKV